MAGSRVLFAPSRHTKPGMNGECQGQKVCPPRLHQEAIIRRGRRQQEGRVLLLQARQDRNCELQEQEVRSPTMHNLTVVPRGLSMAARSRRTAPSTRQTWNGDDVNSKNRVCSPRLHHEAGEWHCRYTWIHRTLSVYTWKIWKICVSTTLQKVACEPSEGRVRSSYLSCYVHDAYPRPEEHGRKKGTFSA